MSEFGPAVETLLDELKGRDKRLRARAAKALGKSGDPRALEALIGTLADPAPAVRQLAAFALGQRRDRRAVEPLIAMMDDADAKVRYVAACAVRKFGRQAYRPLLEAYRTGSPQLRLGVLGLLKPFKEPSVSELLIAALDDPDHALRREAACVLGARKDTRAVDRLVAALAEPGPARSIYLRVLAQIGDRSAFDALTALLADASLAPFEQHEVVNALRLLDNPAAVDHLHERMGDPHDPAAPRLAHTVAGVDLMNAVGALGCNAKGNPFVLLQALAATGSALSEHLHAIRRDEPQPRGEDPHTTSTDKLRALESVVRALMRKAR